VVVEPCPPSVWVDVDCEVSTSAENFLNNSLTWQSFASKPSVHTFILQPSGLLYSLHSTLSTGAVAVADDDVAEVTSVGVAVVVLVVVETAVMGQIFEEVPSSHSFIIQPLSSLASLQLMVGLSQLLALYPFVHSFISQPASSL